MRKPHRASVASTLPKAGAKAQPKRQTCLPPNRHKPNPKPPSQPTPPAPSPPNPQSPTLPSPPAVQTTPPASSADRSVTVTRRPTPAYGTDTQVRRPRIKDPPLLRAHPTPSRATPPVPPAAGAHGSRNPSTGTFPLFRTVTRSPPSRNRPAVSATGHTLCPQTPPPQTPSHQTYASPHAGKHTAAPTRPAPILSEAKDPPALLLSFLLVIPEGDLLPPPPHPHVNPPTPPTPLLPTTYPWRTIPTHLPIMELAQAIHQPESEPTRSHPQPPPANQLSIRNQTHPRPQNRL